MKQIKSCSVPLNLDPEWFDNICKRSYKERLAIAGALIAAEIDMILFLEDMFQNKK